MRQEYLQYESKYDFERRMGQVLNKPFGKIITTGTCLLKAEYSYQGAQCESIIYTHLYWAVVEYQDAQ